MVPTPPDDNENKSRRSGQDLLNLRSFVLLLVGAGVVLLCVHDPRWGAAVLCGITVLGFLAKMVKLRVRRAASYPPPRAQGRCRKGRMSCERT